MLFNFPLGQRVQHKFVRREKVHMGETDVMNSTENLYPEHVLYCEPKRQVVRNRTLLLTGIMEYLVFVFFLTCDAPSITT